MVGWCSLCFNEVDPCVAELPFEDLPWRLVRVFSRKWWDPVLDRRRLGDRVVEFQHWQIKRRSLHVMSFTLVFDFGFHSLVQSMLWTFGT